MDDGPILQHLNVLLGLVQARLLLRSGRRPFHQFYKVVAVNSVHDAEHAPSVVADPLQVLPFAGEGLCCRGEEKQKVTFLTEEQLKEEILAQFWSVQLDGPCKHDGLMLQEWKNLLSGRTTPELRWF